MDIRKIRKLIELIEETGITEIEVKEGEEYLRLSRQNSTQQMFAAPMVSSTPAHVAIQHNPAPVVEKPSVEHKSGHKVCSPMVGTLYTSSSPDSEPFVKIGQQVKIGDTLCIIEAMKMFNEIEADRNGVISEIIVSNGDPVEYGQSLFIIE